MFRYLIAVVGFLFVAFELMFAFSTVALYQSLVFSAYYFSTFLLMYMHGLANIEKEYLIGLADSLAA
ncbi:MAG: hypothetical protein QXI91_00420 [Candidatus Bathyarchaeia archaeon]